MDGILNLGVAAMVGLQFQGLPIPVGDEAVVAVGGGEGQLGNLAPIHQLFAGLCQRDTHQGHQATIRAAGWTTLS